MKRKGKIRWGALAAYVVQVGNAIAVPLGVVAPKVAAGVAIAVATIQGAQKSVVRREYERTYTQ